MSWQCVWSHHAGDRTAQKVLQSGFYCLTLFKDARKFILSCDECQRAGAIKISSLKDDTTQVVNGQRLKHYISGDSYNEDVDVIKMVTPEEFIRIHTPETAEFALE